MKFACSGSLVLEYTAGIEGRGIIGNYVLDRELGRGGMGVVYAAKHRVLDRSAAIKLLLANTIEHRDRVERFFNEARAAMAIDHPGVVKIYDVGVATDGRAYIAMELLEGRSLAALIERGPLPVRTAVDFARQIADALAAAHTAGIIHRDLKPENIIVERESRVRIVDFGIAKLAGPVSVRTATGAVIGTPLYMSPEQCEGAREVDPRSDLYSLGCVMFAMLTGRPPFENIGTGSVIGAHLHVAPPPLRSRCPAASPALEAVVHCLLAKSRDQRFASARAVSAALANPEVAVLLGGGDAAATADLPPAIVAPATWTSVPAPSPPPLAPTVATVSSRVDEPPAKRRRTLIAIVSARAVVAVIIVIFASQCGGTPPAQVAATDPPSEPDAAVVASASPDVARVDAETFTPEELEAARNRVKVTKGSAARTPPRTGSAEKPTTRVAPTPDAQPEPVREPEPQPPPPDAAVPPPLPKVHERILFEPADFSVRSAQSTLDRLVQLHRAHPSATILIVGHAEDTERGNLENLALARGNAVKMQLVSRGVDRNRVKLDTAVTAAASDGSTRRADITMVP